MCANKVLYSLIFGLFLNYCATAGIFRLTDNYFVMMSDSTVLRVCSVSIEENRIMMKSTEGVWFEKNMNEIEIIKDGMGKIIWPPSNSLVNSIVKDPMKGPLFDAAKHLKAYSFMYYLGLGLNIVGAVLMSNNDEEGDSSQLAAVGIGSTLFGTALILLAPVQLAKAGEDIENYARSVEQ